MKTEIIESIDANSNEKVKKCRLPDDYRDEMEKVLMAHQNKLNQFMMLSQQVSDLQIRWFDLRKQITATDESFKSKMKYIAKKLKLSESDPWTYNLQDKCFEMREPPEIEPITAGNIKDVT